MSELTSKRQCPDESNDKNDTIVTQSRRRVRVGHGEKSIQSYQHGGER